MDAETSAAKMSAYASVAMVTYNADVAPSVG